MPLQRTLLASLAIIVAGTAVLAAATRGFQAYTTETLRRLSIQAHPRLVPLVPLRTAAGRVVSFGQWRGKWLLVDFIYTRCLTVCSVQGGEFARLQRALAPQIARGQVMLVSIGFDLPHDTPEALAAYQKRSLDRGAGWLAATPVSGEGLARLMRTFGVAAIPDEFGGYVHNAAISLVDPQGRLVAVIDWNDPGRARDAVLRRVAR